MVHISVLLAFAASVSALPLNINLGAYSPALVVGDGEISFGGKQDVTNLMNALEGAAVSGAAANAAGAPAAAAAPASSSPAAAAAPATNAADQTPQITALQGMGKEIAPRVVPLAKDATKLASRDLAGFDRALTYAAAALKISPEVQLGTGEGGSGVGITVKAGGTTSTTTTPKAGNATKTRRGAFEYDAEGNEIEKRDFEYDAEGNEIEARSFEYDAEGNEIEKRSFEYDAEGNEIEKRSFEYDAEGNEIEKRSTGEAFYYDASSGAAEKKAKRASFEYDAEGNEIENRNLAGKTKTTVTTMYIREGISGASNEGVEKRSVQKRSSRMQRRAPVDGVSLNVAGREGVTLTIVETRSADDKE